MIGSRNVWEQLTTEGGALDLAAISNFYLVFTMSSSQDLQLKAYQTRLKDDVKKTIDHFEQILRLTKTELNEPHLSAAKMQEISYEMMVRAGNMTRAAESIMKLIWDIKQYIIINDFPLINETIKHTGDQYRKEVDDIDFKLMALRDEMSNELYELEEEYYNSIVKWIAWVDKVVKKIPLLYMFLLVGAFLVSDTKLT